MSECSVAIDVRSLGIIRDGLAVCIAYFDLEHGRFQYRTDRIKNGLLERELIETSYKQALSSYELMACLEIINDPSRVGWAPLREHLSSLLYGQDN